MGGGHLNAKKGGTNNVFKWANNTVSQVNSNYFENLTGKIDLIRVFEGPKHQFFQFVRKISKTQVNSKWTQAGEKFYFCFFTLVGERFNSRF